MVAVDCCNGSCNMGPVITRLDNSFKGRLGVIVAEIVTVDIVHESVSVIIYPGLSMQLFLIGPHIGSKVVMGIFDSRIVDGYDYLRDSGRDPPGRQQPDVGTGFFPGDGAVIPIVP